MQDQSSNIPVPVSPVDVTSEVTLSCPTLCYRMDCSLPGSSVHGVFQVRTLQGVATRATERCSQQSFLRGGAGAGLAGGLCPLPLPSSQGWQLNSRAVLELSIQIMYYWKNICHVLYVCVRLGHCHWSPFSLQCVSSKRRNREFRRVHGPRRHKTGAFLLPHGQQGGKSKAMVTVPVC